MVCIDVTKLNISPRAVQHTFLLRSPLSLSLCILGTAVTSACVKMLQRASCGSASPVAFSSASTSEHQLPPLRNKPRVGPIVRSEKTIPSLPRPQSCSSRPQSRQAQTAVQAASPAMAMPGSKTACDLKLELNGSGLQRLKYQREGWQYWNWDDTTGRHRIHYISSGLDNKGPTVLLIHGFGASAYHWRHNIPALVDAGKRVFAVDLLGFGLSDKALVSYDDYSVWQRQLATFMKDVVQDRCILVGNSLGGYNSLSAAASNPELVAGVALLNGAGRFEDLNESAAQQLQDVVEIDPLEAKPVQTTPSDPILPPQPSFWDQMMAAPKAMATRMGLYLAFLYAKQPLRIKQVLQKVYIDTSNVDNDLVQSILDPAQDSAAAECFRLILTGSGESINSMLRRMKQPLLLLWGDKDPWIGPRSADKVMQLYPKASRIRLDAGHCPHDEAPAATNEGLLSWLATLEEA